MMPMAKRNFDEERSLLLANEEIFEESKHKSYPEFKTAIAKGVSNQVGKWPSHLFAAFLAASLVFASLILFALVTALFCIPSANYRCRKARNVDFTEFPNVYFVKHKNRTWNRTELCYVESSARDNPEINVYLINLLTDEPDKMANGFIPMTSGNYEEIANNKIDMMENLVLWEKTNNSMNLSSNITEETILRNRIAARYDNVRNIDVTIDDLFKGSMLDNVFHELDTKTLEIAAKATIIWNTPGIALDPSDFRYIRDSKRYLCKRGCKLTKNAAINSRGSFQASAVSCQAFVGLFIREIASNGGISAKRDVVKRARDNFCQSLRECPGLEVYDESPRISQSPYCPTIYPTRIPSMKMKKIFPFRDNALPWG